MFTDDVGSYVQSRKREELIFRQQIDAALKEDFSRSFPVFPCLSLSIF